MPLPPTPTLEQRHIFNKTRLPSCHKGCMCQPQVQYECSFAPSQYKEIAGCLGKKLKRQTRVIPTESFRNQSPVYSAWRTQGMRTHISTSFFFFPCFISILLFCKEVQKWTKGLLNHQGKLFLLVSQDTAPPSALARLWMSPTTFHLSLWQACGRQEEGDAL